MKFNNHKVLLFLFRYFILSEERCYDYIKENEKIVPYGNSKNYFGNSVAVSDRHLVIGCKFDQENGMNSGAVYVYRNVDNSWVYHNKLMPSGGGGYEEFGNAVALYDNVLVVGSQRDNINGHDSGSVYIFEHVNGTWMEKHILTPSDGRKDALFGQHVAVYGDTLLVNCNSDGTSLAYVFEKVSGNWSEREKLKTTDARPIDQYDHPVAMHGDQVIVGRWYDNEKGYQSGSAVIFRKVDGKWIEQVKLIPSDGALTNWFGVSVAIDDKHVVVSSHGDDVKGDGSGSAYVFERIAGNWIEKAKLSPSNGKAGDSFGYPVVIHKNKIVIGCMGDDAAGPDYNSGAVYVYQNVAGNWTEQYKFLPSDGEYNGRFGYSIAIHDKYAVVGSIKYDAYKTGSVYVFDNLDVSNNTGKLCDVVTPKETVDHYIWILAVSIPLVLLMCCVAFVCVCKRMRTPKIEKGEDQAEFIYHDIAKTDTTVET